MASQAEEQEEDLSPRRGPLTPVDESRTGSALRSPEGKLIFTRPISEIPEFRPMNYIKEKQNKLLNEKYLKMINSADISEIEKLVLSKVRSNLISQVI